MKEVLMTQKEIDEEIDFERVCGLNTLLQNILSAEDENKKIFIYMKINEKDEIAGYVIRDENGTECQL